MTMQEQRRTATENFHLGRRRGTVEVGHVMAWWGVAARVPAGWKIMDGTFAVNGSLVPDMRDKMIIGAGTTYDLGDTGGSSAQAAHSDHSGPTHTGHTHQAVFLRGVTAGSDFSVWEGEGANNITQSTTVAAHSALSHTAHGTNLPPYAAMYWIIYTG